MEKSETLPQGWQDQPEVKALVDKAVQAAAQTRVQESEQLREQVSSLKEQLAKFDGLDPDQAKKALSSVQDKAEREMLEQGKVDQLLETRMARSRNEYEARIKQLDSRLAGLQEELEQKTSRLAEVLVERGIKDAVDEVGVIYKNAWPDVLARGKSLFQIDANGRAVARDADGNLLSGRNDGESLTFIEWAKDLLVNAPHLFASSGNAKERSGGGAAVSGREFKGQNVKLSREQAKDPAQYRSAKKRAVIQGGELVIQ